MPGVTLDIILCTINWYNAFIECYIEHLWGLRWHELKHKCLLFWLQLPAVAYALWGKNLLGSCHMVTSTKKRPKWAPQSPAIHKGEELAEVRVAWEGQGEEPKKVIVGRGGRVLNPVQMLWEVPDQYFIVFYIFVWHGLITKTQSPEIIWVNIIAG